MKNLQTRATFKTDHLPSGTSNGPANDELRTRYARQGDLDGSPDGRQLDTLGLGEPPAFKPRFGLSNEGNSERSAGAAGSAGCTVLDNNAKSSGNRSRRWEARGFLWDYSEHVRVRKCGRVPVSSDGLVGVRANGESVGFAGLASCGSVWSCPVCNSRIQAVRRLEVGVALANVHANGGGAAFGAITVRHELGQGLDGLLAALTYGIARIAQDKTVKRLRAEMGHIGRVQALEVTVGAYGWHPHRHPLALFSRPPDPGKLVQLHMAEFRAFRAGVVRRGYDAPLDVAQFLQPVTPGTGDVLGEYFTKSTYSHDAASWELTSTQTKKATGESRTPWELLDSARKTGDMDDLDLWGEYERALKGKRALTYSRGLRDLVGLGTESTDEQIAGAEAGDKHDTGFWVSDWAPIRAHAQLGAGLLNAVTAAGNWAVGRKYAAAHGIPILENEK